MPDMIDYIIIGNGVSATTAAEMIRSRDPSGSIKMFTDEEYPFYARLRLPQLLAGEVTIEKLILKNEAWYKDNNIDLHLGEPVIDADPKSNTVTTESKDYLYEKLLLAAGSHSVLPPIKGIEQAGIFTLRDVKDTIRIKESVKEGVKAVIIGGGLLGLEAGKALMCLGVEISVVEYFKRLLPRQIDVVGSNILKCLMENLGYKFHLGLETKEIKREDDILKVILSDDTCIDCDMVLVAAGVRPNIELGKKLGLATDKGVHVDEFMRTSSPHIFAAGDIIEYNGKTYGIWPAAKDQGRIAGFNMVELTEKYEDTVIMTA